MTAAAALPLFVDDGCCPSVNTLRSQQQQVRCSMKPYGLLGEDYPGQAGTEGGRGATVLESCETRIGIRPVSN